jgi:hypothetical protein
MPEECPRLGATTAECSTKVGFSRAIWPLAGVRDDGSIAINNNGEAPIVSVPDQNMFTRSVFQTEDMEAQHHLLARLSPMIGKGQISTTLAEVLGPTNAANLTGARDCIWQPRGA